MQSVKGIYHQLTNTQTRLVIVHPGTNDQPIRCSLKVIELSHAEEEHYRAVSYVWGNQENPVDVTVNDSTFKVGQNLHNALLHLRSTSKNRSFWIDAMAINQSDVLERNDQVQKMGTIYALAASVVIWLGQNSDIDPNWDAGNVAGNMSVEDFVSWMRFDAPNEAEEPQTDTFLNALIALSELPYWHRAWVLQEVAMAKRAVVMFGRAAVPYRDFISFWKQEKRDYIDMFGSMGPSYLLEPGSARDENPNKLDLSVWEWINRMQRMDCAEPRDKLYACRALFSAEIRDQIQADYSKSEMAVFAQAIPVLVEASGDLTVTTIGPKAAFASKDIPSWIPDYINGLRDGPYFRNNALVDTIPTTFYQFSPDSKSMLVKGIRLGVIRAVGPEYREIGASIPPLDPILFLVHIHQSFRLVSGLSKLNGPSDYVEILMQGHLEMVNSNEAGAFLMKALTDYVADSAARAQEVYDSVTQDCRALLGVIALSFEHGPVFTYSRSLSLDHDKSSGECSYQDHVHIGVGERSIMVGDQVCLIWGSSSPAVIRKQDGHCKIVANPSLAESFVAEVIQMYKTRLHELEDFLLL
jgi:hypothetical protein